MNKNFEKLADLNWVLGSEIKAEDLKKSCVKLVEATQKRTGVKFRYLCQGQPVSVTDDDTYNVVTLAYAVLANDYDEERKSYNELYNEIVRRAENVKKMESFFSGMKNEEMYYYAQITGEDIDF